MASTTSPGYIVIRLVPTAAVDGPTFATYLDGLELQIFAADTPAGQPLEPLSDVVYFSPLVVYQFPEFGTGVNPFATVSVPTTSPTEFVSSKNYGKSLTFNSTDGISAGSYLFSADPNSPFYNISPPLQVVDVEETLVTFNAVLPNYAPNGSIASFIDQLSVNNPWDTTATGPSFTLKPTGPATALGQPGATGSSALLVIPFASTTGVAVGMAVSSSDSSVAAGTTVALVSSNPPTVTLSAPLSSQITPGTTTLTFALNPPFVSFSLTPLSSALVSELVFNSTSGIAVNMTVTSNDASVASGTTVAGVNDITATVTLSLPLHQPTTNSTKITFNTSPPSTPIVLTPSSSATNSQLIFSSPSGANGVAYGMTVTCSGQPGLIPTGTTVAEATPTTVTLSQQLTGPLAAPPQPVTFTFPLTSGIVQHVEEITWINFTPFSGITSGFVFAPMAVATAVIPLNPLIAPAVTAQNFINISVIATRNGVNIPIDQIFYNVLVNTDALPAIDQYQLIPTTDTALYLSLPPPPGTSPISLAIPSDGSAPPFDVLLQALQNALIHDPILGPVTGTTSLPAVASLISSLTTAQCTQLAYDVVWSYQTALPLPPDPLELLYTNPYFTETATSSGVAPAANTNDEQDRIKFEGTLNSFYSTNNATAERLAKFVAAVAAAIYCEELTLAATSAILEFPVDPTASFVGAVESEVLLQGLGNTAAGTSNITQGFGVPAAFFYALGAKMDKTTTAAQRYQMATGDAIERLLQELSAAEDSGAINVSEPFVTISPPAPPAPPLAISSFQAARRLVALGVSAASSSPPVTVIANSPLAALVTDWLGATSPASLPPPNPQPSYQLQDFAIWTQQLASTDAQGYLEVVLAALTQGYVIAPFTAKTSAATTSGPILTFSSTGGIGVGPGMSVSGTNIPSSASVQTVTTTTTQNVTTTTVTISASVTGTGVSSGAIITFNQPIAPITATTTQDTSASTGSTLTLAATTGITAGMSVNGLNIPNGTTVAAVTPTTVTLSTIVSGEVTSGSTIIFNEPTLPIPVTVSQNVLPGSTVSLSSTSGLANGMLVTGPNIAAGTTVQSVTATTVTINPPVWGDVPKGTIITFTTPVPPNTIPSTLAHQIELWLPSTTSPPTPSPTVATLLAVTRAQWTSFFTNNPSWLPPFTLPAASSSSTTPASASGYLSTRIRAFIRAVQKFFTVSSVPSTPQLPAPGSPPTFAGPPNDLISQAMSSLGAGVTFGSSLTSAQIASAAQSVFSTNPDPVAQAWLQQALTTINELWTIAQVVPEPSGAAQTWPLKANFTFSIVEALYAHGFRCAADITDLTAAEFAQAMTGTVAYDYANPATNSNSLYLAAQSITSATPPTAPAPGPFEPVNPDGTLVNCVPPPCLSPTGPVAYLQDLLNLSEAATCADPNPATGTTLGTAVAARRGPLANLLASCANCETPLPLIDIVNECLEYLGATQPSPAGSTSSPPSGTVYNTSADQLAGYILRRSGDCAGRPRLPRPRPDL